MTHDATLPVRSASIPPNPRLLVLGASFTAGLGYAGAAFPHLVAERLRASAVLDLSASSQTVEEMLAHREAIQQFRPDLTILECGGAEAMVHPGRGVQRLLEQYAPPGWHGVSGLEPRARFSSRPRRRARQRIESWLKVAFKRALIVATGAGPRIGLATCAPQIDELVTFLVGLESQILLLEFWRVGERKFPRTNASFARTNQVLRAVAARHALVELVAVEDALDYWDDFLADRMHLVGSGHEHLAAMLARRAAGVVEEGTDTHVAVA